MGRNACNRSGVKQWSHRSTSSANRSDGPSRVGAMNSPSVPSRPHSGRRSCSTSAETTQRPSTKVAKSSSSISARPAHRWFSKPPLATSIRTSDVSGGSIGWNGAGRPEGTVEQELIQADSPRPCPCNFRRNLRRSASGLFRPHARTRQSDDRKPRPSRITSGGLCDASVRSTNTL